MRRRDTQRAAYDGPLVYTGRGAALADIPARHLTAEEAQRYGGAEALIATGLYASPIGDVPPAAPLVPLSRESNDAAGESAVTEEGNHGNGS